MMRMKWGAKISLLIILLIVVISAYWVGYWNGRFGDWLDAAEPPKPTITVDGKKVGLVLGSYSWRERPSLLPFWDSGKAVIADSIGPIEYFRLHPDRSVPVKAGATIEAEPPEGIVQFDLMNETQEGKVDPYRVPAEKGKTIYSLDMKWPAQGRASYYFMLEVK
jgi:hypothetical protein